MNYWSLTLRSFSIFLKLNTSCCGLYKSMKEEVRKIGATIIVRKIWKEILILSSMKQTNKQTNKTNDSFVFSFSPSQIDGWEGVCFFFIYISGLCNFVTPKQKKNSWSRNKYLWLFFYSYLHIFPVMKIVTFFDFELYCFCYLASLDDDNKKKDNNIVS